jgi:hypothetical protein
LEQIQLLNKSATDGFEVRAFGITRDVPGGRTELIAFNREGEIPWEVYGHSPRRRLLQLLFNNPLNMSELAVLEQLKNLSVTSE